MDRNNALLLMEYDLMPSLSARRAWIEIAAWSRRSPSVPVALRKESVDRNKDVKNETVLGDPSLSARRAWIEMCSSSSASLRLWGRSPQGERG